MAIENQHIFPLLLIILDLGAARRTNFEGLKKEMPKHDCPDDLLQEQQGIMGRYLQILEVRAVIEGIEL